jgi:hypothetical protein
MGDINKSVSVKEEAVRLTADGHPDMSFEAQQSR